MTARYPRPPILSTLPRSRHAVIEASAGTGKTYTIEHLVIDLILRAGATIDQVLVLTFTERAAAELRKRIRGIVVKILETVEATEGDPGESEPDEDGEESDRYWRIDDRARERLTRALYTLDVAAIGTIHGFFGRVLNEHAFTGGRLLVGTLEDGRSLFGRAFRTALRRRLAIEPGPAAELLRLWLVQDRGGIDGLEEALYRYHAARRDVRPPCDLEALRQEIAARPLVVGDRDAEIARLDAALRGARIHGNTVRAICTNHLPAILATLDRAGEGLAPFFDDNAQESIRYLVKKWNELPRTSLAGTLVESVVSLVVRVVPLKAAVVGACLPEAQRALQRYKRATGAYDFDEIIAGVAEAVQSPQGAALVEALRGRFRYALIDEFQDTDENQWAVFQRVFVESDGPHRAFLIGDPKQAIYGFRGADVRAYITARDHVVARGQAPVVLDTNHRSTAALIEAYNLILDQSATQPYFDGAGVTYQAPVRPGRSHTALNADGTPSVPVHVLEIEPRGEKLGLLELRRGLARQIAREARALLFGDQQMSFGTANDQRAVEPGQVFVLTATRVESELVAAELRAAGVPFAFYKQEGLFQTNEAQAVRDLLAAIDDPADPALRGRAWITPFFAVPLGVLPELTEVADTHPLVRRLAEWKDLADARRFEALFSRILDDSGVVLRELLLKDDERALTNYLHLFELLLEHARSHGCGLTELVALLDGYIAGTRKPPAEDGDVQRLESDRDAVQIMSIHKSKGLEAEVVFLFGKFTSFPSDGTHEYHDDDGRRVLDLDPSDDARAAAQRERREEDQRVYYVALTRAKARLYLPFVPPEHWSNRWDGGYRQVNERLARLFDEDERPDLFLRKPFRDQPIVRERPGERSSPRAPAAWSPRRGALDDFHASGEFAALRDRHRPLEVVSYSRMKRELGTVEDAPVVADEISGAGDASALAPEDLPGGRTTGTLLHEILEEVPLDETAVAADLDAWRSLPAVATAVETALTRHAFDPAHRPEVEALVYQALTTHIPVGHGRTIPGLCGGTRALREMEFFFPIPEGHHPRIAEARPGKLVIERGYVKGYIDLVVEHGGALYFADWKGDVLDSYEPRALARHVTDQYGLQAMLYVLALVKALRIRDAADYEARFGGLVYVFLRGLRRPGPAGMGLHFARPGWAEVLGYEDKLVRLTSPSSSSPRGGSR